MNLLPQGANDGMTLYLTWNDTDYQYLLFLQLEINYQLISGKRYRELPVRYFEPLPFYEPRNYLSDFHRFIRYARHLDQFEFGEALEIIDKIWEEHGSSSSPYQVDLAKELLFCLAILKKGDERITEIYQNKAIMKLLEQPLIANKRILASYQLYVAENPRQARLLAEEGLNQSTNAANKGDSLMETELINWLLEQITRVEQRQIETNQNIMR